MILSFGLKGPRESRPSLLITYQQTNKQINKYKKVQDPEIQAGLKQTHQSNFVLLFHDEELISVDVEVCRVQQSLQGDQTNDLGANHRELQLLNTTTTITTSTYKKLQFLRKCSLNACCIRTC